MDHLRRGIHLRGYAQKNPKQEYKREAFNLFETMLSQLKEDVIRVTCHVQVQQPEELEAMERRRKEELERQMARAKAVHDDGSALDEGGEASRRILQSLLFGKVKSRKK